MKFERLSICLIIPFNYDKVYYNDLSKEMSFNIEQDFLLKTIKAPKLNLFGEKLLTAENALVKCYECKPKSRKKLGLHSNEKTRYCLKKNTASFPFKIGNIQIWFFRSGRAFLTMPIIAENVTAEQGLDWQNFLTDIQAGNKITYCIKLGKEEIVEPVITLKELIKGREKPLYEREGETVKLIGCMEMLKNLKAEISRNETCKKAYSITYGLADNVSESFLQNSLEAFRERQRSTAGLVAGVKEEYKFQKVKHLTWLASEYGIAAIGDYKTADENGGSNRIVLKDFWENIIIPNYRVMYLYYLYTWFECKKLQNSCIEVKRDLSKMIDSELIEALSNLEGRLEPISIEPRQDVFFREYLCRNVWNLQENINQLVHNDLPWVMEYCDCDIFISYRRDGGFYFARLLYAILQQKRKRPYLDLERLKLGAFNEQLYQAIERCKVFLVVLSPGSLDRCEQEEDWVRKEIVYALKCKKCILPVKMEGFKYPEKMPEDMKAFSMEHAIGFTMECFNACVENLIEKLQV